MWWLSLTIRIRIPSYSNEYDGLYGDYLYYTKIYIFLLFLQAVTIDSNISTGLVLLYTNNPGEHIEGERVKNKGLVEATPLYIDSGLRNHTGVAAEWALECLQAHVHVVHCIYQLVYLLLYGWLVILIVNNEV